MEIAMVKVMCCLTRNDIAVPTACGTLDKAWCEISASPQIIENKAAGAAVPAARTLADKCVFLSESALCPAPTGSVSFIVVHIKSDWMVMLSDWMVMAMTNGNCDDDNLRKWQR